MDINGPVTSAEKNEIESRLNKANRVSIQEIREEDINETKTQDSESDDMDNEATEDIQENNENNINEPIAEPNMLLSM